MIAMRSSKRIKDLAILCTLVVSCIFILPKLLPSSSLLLLRSTNRGPDHDQYPTSRSLTTYQRNRIKFIPYEVISHNYLDVVGYDEINWNEYAYVQYATDWNYLCSAIMNFAQLRNFNTKVDLVLMITKNIKLDEEEDTNPEVKKFQQNVKKLKIKVQTVELLKYASDSTTWNKSFTKFNAFKLTQYKRVVYFDSDAKVLQKFDELFFIPDCKIAMPSAYELNYELYAEQNLEIPDNFLPLSARQRQLKYKTIYQRIPTDINLDTYLGMVYNELPDIELTKGFKFGNQLMVIKPSLSEYDKLIQLTNNKESNEYDMDIINKLYNVDAIANRLDQETEQLDLKYGVLNLIPDCLVLPHIQYGFLTGEFRYSIHEIVLADPQDLPYALSSKLKLKIGSSVYWSSTTSWDALKIFNDDIKLIHFSDHPIPKPWIKQTLPNDYAQYKIMCEDDLDRFREYEEYNSKQVKNEADYILPSYVSDCDAATIWNQLYEDYADDRLGICGLELI